MSFSPYAFRVWRLLGLVIVSSAFLLSPSMSTAFLNGAIQRPIRTAPLNSFIPTQETRVAELLSANPDYDGRGTTVAVLDTGCDLRAAGLLKTSTGENKYVDFIDATGGGDIDMSATVTPHANATFTSPITKRTLTIPPNLNTIRVGATRLFTHLPSSSKERILSQRKKSFLHHHTQTLTQLQKQIDDLDSSMSNHTSVKKDKTTLLEEVKAMADDYDDPGPLLDVISWKGEDGEWKVRSC